MYRCHRCLAADTVLVLFCLRALCCNYLCGGRAGYHATLRSANLSSASTAELQVLLGGTSSAYHSALTAAA